MKFLVSAIIFILLYLAFYLVREFDSNLVLTAGDYEIVTTIFNAGAIFLIAQLSLLLIIKLIKIICNLPADIYNFFREKKSRKLKEKLLAIIAYLLTGNRKKALTLITDINPWLKEKAPEIIDLINIENETDHNEKIQGLKRLINKKIYSKKIYSFYNLYAAKKLAGLFYSSGNYQEAEKFAHQAWAEDAADTRLALFLLKIYSKLDARQKLITLINKLHSINPEFLEKNRAVIAGYYYLLATKTVENEAIEYLKLALELKPDHLDALTLFTKINISMNNSKANLPILAAAFGLCPCFEIAVLYIDCFLSVNSSNHNSLFGTLFAARDNIKEETRAAFDNTIDNGLLPTVELNNSTIYSTFAGLASPDKHVALFLAIAALLNLPEEIEKLRKYCL